VKYAVRDSADVGAWIIRLK